MLPWISWHREKLRDENDKSSDGYLYCNECLAGLPEEARRRMRCGYLPDRSSEPGFLPPIGWPEFSDDPCVPFTVCPGYSSTLPEVFEVSRALSWSRRGGGLRDFYRRDYPKISDELLILVDALDAEISRVERHSIREVRNKGS